jgi:hypothetical protein
MVLSTSPSAWRVLRLAHGAHHLHVHGGCRRNQKNALFFNLCVPSRTIFQLSIGDKSKKNVNKSPSSSEDKDKKPWREAASLMIVAPMNEAPPYSLGYLVRFGMRNVCCI